MLSDRKYAAEVTSSLGYLLFLAAAVLLLFVQYLAGEKRRRAALVQRLRSQWGQTPDREYGEGDLSRIRRYYQMHQEESWSIDDITWNDLGLDEIFMLLNHTGSSVGEEALYRLLRTPVFDREILKERDRLARLFAENEELRLELEKRLHVIGKNGRRALCDSIDWLSGQPHRSNTRHYLGLAAIVLAAGLTIFYANAGVPALAGVVIFQMITYYQQKAQVENCFLCVAEVVRLAACGQEICRLSGAESLSEYLRPLGVQVRELEPIRGKARFITTGNTMGGSPFDLIADYVKMLFHTDLISFNQLVCLTKQKEQVIWNVVDLLGRLECGLAIASFRQCLGEWCEPDLETQAEKPYLDGVKLYHPLIDCPVPNTVHAGRNQLITGSNASGKSTFLKTVAVNAVLAQTVDTVAGKSYRAPLFQIYSSMALTDNLAGGESYYMAEIRSLKRILDRGRDRLPVLCFVDEVLRGTNTVERIAASAQILKSMTGMNLLCFAATHDGELTVLLEPWYENSHFEEEIADGDVLFSYRLHPGRAVGRNALRLLGWMGYDEQVLREAQDMAERFDRTGIWSM